MRSKKTETPQHNTPNPFAEQPRRRMSHKNRKWFIVAGAVILLGVGTWLAWPALSGLFNKADTAKDQPVQPQEISEETKQKIVIQDTILDKLKSGGKDAAQDYLDEQLETADTDEQKAFILVSKSNVASNDPDQARSYALEADELDPSYTTASTLATLYEQSGDTQNALRYYRLMLERATLDFQQTYPDDYASINKKINILEEQ